MDGLHWPDLLVLIAVGLLVFGPKRLPEIGAAVGTALREFRAAVRGDGRPEPPDTAPAAQIPTRPEPAAPTETEGAVADAPACTVTMPTSVRPERAPESVQVLGE